MMSFMNSSIRTLTETEVMLVAGAGYTTITYDEDGRNGLLNHYDDNGNFLGCEWYEPDEFSIYENDSDLYSDLMSNELSDGSGDDGSGVFLCAGGGLMGGVAGACVATPIDAYVYAGVGTPGPSISGGFSSDTNTYLTGLGGSVTTPLGGLGSTADGGTQAVVFGNNSGSVTYGISISDTVEGVLDALAEAGDQLADHIYDTYYPPVEPDPTADE